MRLERTGGGGRGARSTHDSWGAEYALKTPGNSADSTAAAARGGGRRPPTVPEDESTRLWDFPDIKKYMVIRSRANFWPQMDKMNKEHTYESTPFSWPEPTADTGSSRAWVRTGSQSIDDTVVPGGRGGSSGAHYQNAFPSSFDWPRPQGHTSAFPPSTSLQGEQAQEEQGQGEQGQGEQYVKAGALLKRCGVCVCACVHVYM